MLISNIEQDKIIDARTSIKKMKMQTLQVEQQQKTVIDQMYCVGLYDVQVETPKGEAIY